MIERVLDREIKIVDRLIRNVAFRYNSAGNMDGVAGIVFIDRLEINKKFKIKRFPPRITIPILFRDGTSPDVVYNYVSSRYTGDYCLYELDKKCDPIIKKRLKIFYGEKHYGGLYD